MPLAENLRLHRLLTEGVPVEHRVDDGSIRHALAWLIDFEQPGEQRLARGQPVHGPGGGQAPPARRGGVRQRPAARAARAQEPGRRARHAEGRLEPVQTYRTDIPAIFTPNAVCVVSDGSSAVMGSFTAGFEHYAPWKTIDGREVVTDRPQLEVLSPRRVRAERASSTWCATSSCSPTSRRAGEAGREVSPVLGGQRGGRVDDRGVGPERRPPRRRRLAHAGLRQVLRDAAATRRR